MSRAFWTESAERDLASLDDRAELTIEYTDRVCGTALSAMRFLADHPMAGSMLASGLRKWAVRGTPYILIYRPTVDGVQIIRFLDARSDWRTAFD